MIKLNILDFDENLLSEHMLALGEKKFRARQIIQSVHQQFITDFDDITTLSKDLRNKLKQHFYIKHAHAIHESISFDGTIKWLIQVDAANSVETVYIPEKNRATLCVSSQAGCALDCSFCLTGKQGLNRNLTTAEIIGQLQFAVRRIQELEANKPMQKITNIVFMGMGEPLANEKAVYPTLNLMLSDHAYGLSKYKVTISTSGLVPAMERLKQNSPCALAVSLHAPTDALRDKLVPINKRYPLAKLMATCRDYFTGKRGITFEYVMLCDVNDQPSHARELVKLLKTIPNCKLNLIPFNPAPGLPYQRSADTTIDTFAQITVKADIVTTVRRSRGPDILAACGQLEGDIHDLTRRKERSQT